jgi:hypothetical protein
LRKLDWVCVCMRCFARWLTEPFYRSWAQVTLGEYIEVMARRPVVHDDFNDSSMVILSWPYPSYLYNYTVSGYSIPRLVQLTPHFVPQWGYNALAHMTVQGVGT